MSFPVGVGMQIHPLPGVCPSRSGHSAVELTDIFSTLMGVSASGIVKTFCASFAPRLVLTVSAMSALLASSPVGPVILFGKLFMASRSTKHISF